MCHSPVPMSAAHRSEAVPHFEAEMRKRREEQRDSPDNELHRLDPQDIYEVVGINRPGNNDGVVIMEGRGRGGGNPPISLDIHPRPHVVVRPPPTRVNLSHTIRRLRMCGWYWGDITSNQANVVLRNAQNGSFILRDSTDACHLFTLSLKANNIVVSVRVAFSRGMFKLDSWNQEDSPSFNSVVDMIEYYLSDEKHEFYVELPNVGEFPVCLKHPIWKSLPSLQHQCRYAIVKCCRTSQKLRLLPLPAHLVRYLLDFSPEDPGESGNGESVYENERLEEEDLESENSTSIPQLRPTV